MEGANGGTTFTDVKGHTFTAGGSARTSTAQKIAGNTSAQFNAGGNAYVDASHADFSLGTSDFTIECYFLLASYPVTTNNRLLETAAYNSATPGFLIYYDYATTLMAVQLSAALGSARILSNTSPPLSWIHYAFVRAGNTGKQFLNGVMQTTQVFDLTGKSFTSTQLRLGQDIGVTVGPWTGYMDEFRFTKSARYTANFTPPPAPFPDL